MSDDPDESIYVHPSIDEFESIINYEQVRRLRANAEGTKYNNCAFRLCVDWKATANSVTFYHTFITLFESYSHTNYTKKKTVTTFGDAAIFATTPKPLARGYMYICSVA